jgi:hypothetical protein
MTSTVQLLFEKCLSTWPSNCQTTAVEQRKSQALIKERLDRFYVFSYVYQRKKYCSLLSDIVLLSRYMFLSGPVTLGYQCRTSADLGDRI